jgi:transposase
MAIELSKKSWIIAVNTLLSDKIRMHTVESSKQLAELLDKTRTRVGRELKRPVAFVSCYEADYDERPRTRGVRCKVFKSELGGRTKNS